MFFATVKYLHNLKVEEKKSTIIIHPNSLALAHHRETKLSKKPHFDSVNTTRGVFLL